MKRKHLVIINPKSFYRRNTDRIVPRVSAFFESAAERQDFRIYVSQFPRDAIVIIRDYMKTVDKDTIIRVYAIGGDGILFDCVNSMEGLSNIEFAVMPYGTGNDFVRSFGEGLEAYFRDIALQAAAPVVPTDVLRCGNNYALNYCAIGLEADAILKSIGLNSRIEKLRRMFRPAHTFMYIVGAVLAAFHKQVLEQHYTINADGEDLSGNYSSINIANGPCYGNTMFPVCTASPADGWMDVIFLRRTRPLRILTLILPYVTGKFYKYPTYFLWRRVKKITVTSASPLFVNMDGESFFDSELTIEIIPGAVKMAAVNGAAYQIRRAAPYE